MTGFLDEVRVLDLTQGSAGPACTKLLADWGADVIKIERPVDGDAARSWPPFVADQPGPDRSLDFLYLNGNKRSITLNLKAPEARSPFEALVRWADIVVESYQPATAEALGLTYERISQVNPSVVMVSISSFGKFGPYRDYQSTSIVEYAISGLMYHIGEYNDEPLVHGVPQGEYIAAINAANGAIAGLLYSEETGEGQHVDVSIMDCLAMTQSVADMSAYSYAGGIVGRTPPHPGLNHLMACADGYIVPIARQEWEMLAAFLDAPKLLEERFLGDNQRFRLADEVDAILHDRFSRRSRYELFHGAQALGLIFGVVQDIADLDRCPQLAYRDYWIEMDHPEAGHLRYPGAPFRASESIPAAPCNAPTLGQHNEEVLQDLLGFRLDDLALAGALSADQA